MTLPRERARRPGRVDVLVVGGGPSGAALRLLAGQAGHDVVAGRAQALPPGEDLRRRPHPPVGPPARGHGPRRGAGRRSTASRACGPTPSAAPSSCAGPSTRSFPDYGYVITRKDLDALVAARAAEGRRRRLGASRGGRARSSKAAWSAAPWSWPRTTRRRRRPERGPGPLRRGGRRGQLPLRPVARHQPQPGLPARAWPSGATATSPRHDEPWIDSWLDIRDKAGNVLPGYGWIFPVGDGRINVGIGLLSTFNQWKAVNTTHLLESFVEYAPAVVGAPPRDVPAARRPAAGCRWACRSGPASAPPGWSSATPAGPSTRSTARASPTPTRPGRLAADAVHLALASGDGLALQTYEQRLEDDVRPVLQGGPGVRADHRPARADEGPGRPPACAAAP